MTVRKLTSGVYLLDSKEEVTVTQANFLRCSKYGGDYMDPYRIEQFMISPRWTHLVRNDHEGPLIVVLAIKYVDSYMRLVCEAHTVESYRKQLQNIITDTQQVLDQL